MRKYFQLQEFNVFADLDDTITQNTDIFYSKVKLLDDKGDCDLKKLLRDFSPNQKFIDICKKNNFTNIVILSRNSQKFIDTFIKETRDIFLKYGIVFEWWIGVSIWFNINTKEKLLLLPENSYIISDIFEYQDLKKYKNFISIENFSYFRYYIVVLKKVFYLCKFYFSYD